MTTLHIGDLISIVKVRDGLGRPRFWKTAEIVGFEGRTVITSYYKSFKDSERTIERVRLIDLELFTKKDLDVSIKGYEKYMAEVGDHKNEEWKLLKELGYIK